MSKLEIYDHHNIENRISPSVKEMINATLQTCIAESNDKKLRDYVTEVIQTTLNYFHSRKNWHVICDNTINPEVIIDNNELHVLLLDMDTGEGIRFMIMPSEPDIEYPSETESLEPTTPTSRGSMQQVIEDLLSEGGLGARVPPEPERNPNNGIYSLDITMEAIEDIIASIQNGVYSGIKDYHFQEVTSDGDLTLTVEATPNLTDDMVSKCNSVKDLKRIQEPNWIILTLQPKRD